jgi:hypothetical protein
MVGPFLYDAMYRWGAPWDGVGVREELLRLLDLGEVTPATHPEAIDLGCGTGANVVELARRGFAATGVDFSSVALRKARARADHAGVHVRTRFLEIDLTAERSPPRSVAPTTCCWTSARLTTSAPPAVLAWRSTSRRWHAPAPLCCSGASTDHAASCPGSASTGRPAWHQASSPARSRRCSDRRSTSSRSPATPTSPASCCDASSVRRRRPRPAERRGRPPGQYRSATKVWSSIGGRT